MLFNPSPLLCRVLFYAQISVMVSGSGVVSPVRKVIVIMRHFVLVSMRVGCRSSVP